jgi:hypothetical protein
MSKSIIALAITILLGVGSIASALEGYDGDNNAVPGTAYGQHP